MSRSTWLAPVRAKGVLAAAALNLAAQMFLLQPRGMPALGTAQLEGSALGLQPLPGFRRNAIEHNVGMFQSREKLAGQRAGIGETPSQTPNRVLIHIPHHPAIA